MIEKKSVIGFPSLSYSFLRRGNSLPPVGGEEARKKNTESLFADEGMGRKSAEAYMSTFQIGLTGRSVWRRRERLEQR